MHPGGGLSAVASLNRVSEVVDSPVLQGLRHDPDNVGTALSVGVDQAETEGSTARRTMPAEVTVRTKLHRHVREDASRDTTEGLLPLLGGFRVGVALHRSSRRAVP